LAPLPSRSTNNPWLTRFAWFTAGATWMLICFGGLVTSHGAGLAVPDWPNTYGYNLFFFPVSRWVGGIFYEHTHRLVASGVGLLTTILAVWLWLKESRSWLRWLGVLAFVGVVFQGVLGGLRVTLLKDELGIVHATLAQLFLVLVSAIALFTTRWWTGAGRGTRVDRGLRFWVGLGTGLVLLQLVLGATMRHQHAGLAIPDFPLAYGRLWPAMDEESVARYNQRRVEVQAAKPISAFQIGLQMAHRLGAFGILIAVAATAWRAQRRLRPRQALTQGAWVWLGLVLLQVILGAATIWTNKSADIATTHVAVGALTMVVGAGLCLLAFRQAVPAEPAAHGDHVGGATGA
jgi:cytochrome c oxidase assembly protein subunit 15